MFEFSAMTCNLLSNFLMPRLREWSIQLILEEEKIKAVGDSKTSEVRKLVLKGKLLRNYCDGTSCSN